MVSQTILSKPWSGGLAMPTSCISGPHQRPWYPFHCRFLETFVGAFQLLPLISVAWLVTRGQVTAIWGLCVSVVFVSWGRLGSCSAWGCLGKVRRFCVTLFEGPCSLQAWVIPTCRVAMDTSLLCLKCSGPLQTYKAPVSNLIGNEFKCG